jgi:hypothetical protein
MSTHRKWMATGIAAIVLSFVILGFGIYDLWASTVYPAWAPFLYRRGRIPRHLHHHHGPRWRLHHRRGDVEMIDFLRSVPPWLGMPVLGAIVGFLIWWLTR